MQGITLMNGSIGQALVRRSGQAPSPLWSATVMLEQPDLVTRLYKEYIHAGSTVLTLNTYTATPGRLERDAGSALFAVLHQRAKECLHRAIEETQAQNIQIAACLPPLMASYDTSVVPDFETCLAQYRQIAAIQADICDIFLCETQAQIAESRAALHAAKEYSDGKPIWLSFTVNDDAPTTLRGGEPLQDAREMALEEGVQVLLLNCSSPEAIDAALPILRAQQTCPVGAYANGFECVTALKPGKDVSVLKTRLDVTPERYAAYGLKWAQQGVSILGGCCEVGPAHIKALYEKVQSA